MSYLFVAPGFKNYQTTLRKSFLAAGEAWRGELGKYPPQKSGSNYVRTGRLRAVAGYKMGVESVGLGGIYYTPYVIEPCRGTTAWPGKEDAAFKAAEEAFRVYYIKGLTGL